MNWAACMHMCHALHPLHSYVMSTNIGYVWLRADELGCMHAHVPCFASITFICYGNNNGKCPLFVLIFLTELVCKKDAIPLLFVYLVAVHEA